ncbi:MAG: hypothetical protein ABR502_06730 [Chitinophagaceae bacterium]
MFITNNVSEPDYTRPMATMIEVEKNGTLWFFTYYALLLSIPFAHE